MQRLIFILFLMFPLTSFACENKPSWEESYMKACIRVEYEKLEEEFPYITWSLVFENLWWNKSMKNCCNIVDTFDECKGKVVKYMGEIK